MNLCERTGSIRLTGFGWSRQRRIRTDPPGFSAPIRLIGEKSCVPKRLKGMGERTLLSTQTRKGHFRHRRSLISWRFYNPALAIVSRINFGPKHLRMGRKAFIVHLVRWNRAEFLGAVLNDSGHGALQHRTSAAEGKQYGSFMSRLWAVSRL